MKIYRRISFFFAIFVGIFIFYISSLENPPNPIPKVELVPILYHFGIFFLFSFFIVFSLEKSKENFIFSIIFCFIYACLDEIHQFYVPFRTASFFDLSVDFIGIFLGTFAIFLRRN